MYTVGEHTYCGEVVEDGTNISIKSNTGDVIVMFPEQADLYIGKFCSLSSKVTIFLGGSHNTEWISGYPFENANGKNHCTTKGNVTIKNDVWLGYGSTIMSGVTIGNGAVVSAQAVVTKDVPDYAIVAGNPAKLVSYRFDTFDISNLLEIAWWDWEYKEIVRAIHLIQSKDVEALWRYYEKYIKKPT